MFLAFIKVILNDDNHPCTSTVQIIGTEMKTTKWPYLYLTLIEIIISYDYILQLINFIKNQYFLRISGTLLLSSAQNESTDLLWVLSGDSFPFQNMLMEGQTVLSVDGRVWALEEIPYKGQLSKLYSDSFGSQNPPSSVIQHAQPARTFVLISAQGTHIVSKLRPVDHLRQLLLESNGPDG